MRAPAPTQTSSPRVLRRLLVASNTDVYVAARTRDFFARLIDAGVEVHVICPPGDFVGELKAQRMQWSPLHMRRGRGGLWTAPRALLDLTRAIRRIQPDLAMHLTAMPVLVGTAAAALKPSPAVVNVLPGLGHLFATPQRGTGLERALVRLAFRWVAGRRSSALVFQLEADRHRILPDAATHPFRAAVIPGWGVDLERFRLERSESSPPQVVLVARMLWEKGVSDFVEAARRLRAAGHPARFILVGAPDGGNPGSISAAQLARWNEEGHVEWWGWRSDIPELLSHASLLVFPTRYGEGVPRVLVEAAAAGLPVVAGDVPGCRAIVRDGVTGWLVPTENVDALSRAIERALSDPSARASVGEAARRAVQDPFGVDLVLDRYRDIFRDLGRTLPNESSR